MTVKEASAQWGVSEDKVRKLCREGKVPNAEKLYEGWSIPDNAVFEDGQVVLLEETEEITEEGFFWENWLGKLLLFGFFAFAVATVFCLVGILNFDMSDPGAFVFPLSILLFGGFSYLCFHLMKPGFADVKRKLEQEKQAGGKELKNKVIKACAVTGSALLAVFLCSITIVGFSESKYVNEEARELVALPVDEAVFEKIAEFDEKYKKRTFLEKAFFTQRGKVRRFKKSADEFLENRANHIEEGIPKLIPFEDITSQKQYDEIYNRIADLKADGNEEYVKQLELRVENYNEYRAYKEKFDRVCKEHTLTKGCSLCGGSGKITCSSCNGRGEELVKWYEYGDWGEKSYTSYDCTSCNGRGRSSCRACDGEGIVQYFDFEE